MVVYSDGQYELTSFELTNRYEFEKVKVIQKFNTDTIVTAVYLDGSSKKTFIKKFSIETTTINKKFLFISESKGSKLLFASTKSNITLDVDIRMKRKKHKQQFNLDDLVVVKGWKAVGNKFSSHPIIKIRELSGEETVVEDEQTDGSKAIVAGPADGKQEHAIPKKEESTLSPNKKNKDNLTIKSDEKKERSVAADSGKGNKKREKAPKQSKGGIETSKEDNPKNAGKKPVKKDPPLETSDENEGFHSGDTVEMKIDLEKLRNKKDQLGLFDE